MAIDFEKLKTTLIEKKRDAKKVNKFVSYVYNEMEKEKNRSKQPVSSNDIAKLINMFVKYDNIGVNIDGVNAVITGREMVLITANGLKNKVISIYPELEIDWGIVKAGDEFKLAKESGAVLYTHNYGNPFGDNDTIEGSYCVMKNNRGEYIETLNKQDFNNMKNASRSQNQWNTWASEYWVKSVIKRAAKRHYADELKEFLEIDNEEFDQEKLSGVENSVLPSSDLEDEIVNNAKKKNS